MIVRSSSTCIGSNASLSVGFGRITTALEILMNVSHQPEAVLAYVADGSAASTVVGQ
jgi:threonine dehydratase